MSIDLNLTDLIQSVKDRTFHLEVFTTHGTDYKFVAHRERIFLNGNGEAVFRLGLPDVVRTVSQVMTDPAAMQMLGAVRDMADTWAIEDATTNP